MAHQSFRNADRANGKDTNAPPSHTGTHALLNLGGKNTELEMIANTRRHAATLLGKDRPASHSLESPPYRVKGYEP
jgi:hypothetical protein